MVVSERQRYVTLKGMVPEVRGSNPPTLDMAFAKYYKLYIQPLCVGYLLSCELPWMRVQNTVK